MERNNPYTVHITESSTNLGKVRGALEEIFEMASGEGYHR